MARRAYLCLPYHLLRRSWCGSFSSPWLEYNGSAPLLPTVLTSMYILGQALTYMTSCCCLGCRGTISPQQSLTCPLEGRMVTRRQDGRFYHPKLRASIMGRTPLGPRCHLRQPDLLYLQGPQDLKNQLCPA